MIVVTFVTFLGLCSCNRIKNKSKELVKQTEQKARDKTKEASDKLLPIFDSETPDTKWNKKRFAEFLQVELTPDIRNIYCFDDAIGIDASYRFSFSCESSTLQRIIDRHQMIADSVKLSEGIIFTYTFDWWQKDRIEQLQSYSWKSADERVFKHLWYDNAEQRAYYIVYDL